MQGSSRQSSRQYNGIQSGFLVLQREVDEDIVITLPNNPIPIVIRLLEIGRGRVRLGFQAAENVRIDRAEIYNARR